jgi:hypothetical protein
MEPLEFGAEAGLSNAAHEAAGGVRRRGGGRGKSRTGGRQAKKPRMCAVCGKTKHVTEVLNTEKRDREDLEQVKDTQIHQHLFPLFFDKASQEVQQRVRNVPGFLCDATYYFVKNLRLFSMSR